MEELIRDFHWELDRFVVYRSPLKTTNEIKKSHKKIHFRFRVGTEIVIDIIK
jgi:hypothetical protein